MDLFLKKLKNYRKDGSLSEQGALLFQHFYESYSKALSKNIEADIPQVQVTLLNFLDLVIQQIATPYTFEAFHQRILSPFDYYHFGLDFFRPLIDFNRSKILGQDNLKQLVDQLKIKDNIILFGNHQTEPDPQIISLLLEKIQPKFAEEIIFVAGHRVVTDPMAVPFSMGRNLLCIFSKKYIDHPLEEKPQKLLHNQRTMKRMGQLLSEGGKCIYVAPSGGRDRPNQQGVLDVAPFDAQSIEMFYLMAKQASHPTHFYPLALSTYHLTPPPNKVEKELGEMRPIDFGPAYIAFGKEIDMEKFPGNEEKDRRLRRQKRADAIQTLVKEDYDLIRAD